jgi:hypothetical protein
MNSLQMLQWLFLQPTYFRLMDAQVGSTGTEKALLGAGGPYRPFTRAVECCGAARERQHSPV